MPLFEYAAKVIVGRSNGNVAAPGEYWTAINIHNPGPKVQFAVKVAVGLPGMKSVPPSKFTVHTLGPDFACEIDNGDILRLAKPQKGFVKGFVVIHCERELDVVTVYTAAPKGSGVETIHTERVPARILRRQISSGRLKGKARM